MQHIKFIIKKLKIGTLKIQSSVYPTERMPFIEWLNYIKQQSLNPKQ